MYHKTTTQTGGFQTPQEVSDLHSINSLAPALTIIRFKKQMNKTVNVVQVAKCLLGKAGR